MILPAISIQQSGPGWASMIASGRKTMETRLRYTRYRGPLVICASAQPRVEGLPAGQALCIVMMSECRRMRQSDEQAACCDIYEGAYVWVFTRRWQILPFTVRGKPGIFTLVVPEQVIVDPAAIAEIQAALASAERAGCFEQIR
jgi:hypothetical protein